MSIISARNQIYRLLLLPKLTIDVETREPRRKANKWLTAGMKGFADSFDSRVLDVSYMVNHS